MTPTAIATVLIAVLGSGALTALITGLQARKRVQAETVQIGAATLTTLDPIVSQWLARMQTEITELQKEVAQLRHINAQLISALQEHDVPVPPAPNL